MKQLFFSLFFISCACVVMDEELIIMPDAATLTARLNGLSQLSDFATKTKIVSELAGEEKFSLGVVNALNEAMLEYTAPKNLKGMPKPTKEAYIKSLEMRKPVILQALLQDHPQALASLKKQGLYNPSEAKKS